MRTWENTLDPHARIVFKLDVLKWSVSYLFYTGKWECIARIDNYPHDRKQLPHIHRYRQDKVEFRDLTFNEAEEVLISIGNRIRERIKDGSY
ncbi:hypothetical protein GF345_05330 [Candidatus Woesearchaeota archaeon]|nr:hypothetical protein [Candidatus Woesearchaeota archaeon]